jgi:hypothetical protein
MLYGVIGAHRSGKTSTAKAVADTLGIEFLDSSFNVAREYGFDPVAPMSLEMRLDMQEKVLGHHLAAISEAGRPLITDRTPLDFLAYTLAEFGMNSDMRCQPETLERAARYAQACLDLTAGNYDMLFVLEPLPVYEVDTTKATPVENPALQRHIDTLIQGAVAQLYGRVNSATVQPLPLAQRVEMIAELIVERMDEIDGLKKLSGMH